MYVSKYCREPASGSRQRQPAFSISKTDRCQTVPEQERKICQKY
ncbi:hypothetical protein CLOSYM_00116 [[Clostridium] symbiosum ATCC 14940]|uniref:Uncharacterized protein n=1 Tax=[Clostridium] symbiosum ATCC 14940 TaxID=411472 RepID=A0ABC9U464_CLOSY|nr:hypothetical protein CLOSYM_00116 [[Clostridium] symbiosum ATCC 14940]